MEYLTEKMKKVIVLFLCAVCFFTATSCEKKNTETNTETNGINTISTDQKASARLTNTENTGDISHVAQDTPYFTMRYIESIYENDAYQNSYVRNIVVAESKAAVLMEISDAPKNDNENWVNRFIILIVDERGRVIREINVQDIIQDPTEQVMKILVDKNNNLMIAVKIFNSESLYDSGIRLYKINMNDGNLIDVGDLTYPKNAIEAGYPGMQGEYVYFTDILIDKNNCFFISGQIDSIFNTFILAFDENLQYWFALEDYEAQNTNEDSWYFQNNLFTDGEHVYGIVTHYIEGTTNKDDKLHHSEFEQYIHPINTKEYKLDPALQGVGSGMQIYQIQSGFDGLYYKDNIGIYRIFPSQESMESVFLWKDLDIDFSGFEVETIVMSENTVLAFDSLHRESEGEEFYCQWLMFNKQDINPNSGKKILRIGSNDFMEDNTLPKAVYLFNQYSKDTHAEIFSYKADNIMLMHPEKQIDRMNQSILSGEAPDIFFASSDMYENDHFEQYANRGLLVDLKEKINIDDELVMADFYENILCAAEKNGHIYYMFPYFRVEGYEGKTAWIGEQSSWTIDELNDFSQSLPNGMSLFSYDTVQEDLLREIIRTSLDDFYMEKTASFDTLEFQNLLEFVKINAVSLKKITELEEKGQWDYNLVPVFYPSTYSSAMEFFWLYDEMEPTTFVGYPTIKESKRLCTPGKLVGIFASSSQQESAWTFIKYLFSEEIQDTTVGYSIPVRKTSIEKRIDAAKQEYMEMFGERVQFDGNQTNPTEIAEVSIVSNASSEYSHNKALDVREEKFKKILSDIQGVQCIDKEIWTIIEEESLFFFIDAVSSKEAADTIQERVAELLNNR